MGEMDFLDEIDLEYRQYCHKPLPGVVICYACTLSIVITLK